MFGNKNLPPQDSSVAPRTSQEDVSQPLAPESSNAPASLDLESETLRIQAARTSDGVLARFLEGIQNQMTTSLNEISTKLTILGEKQQSLESYVFSKPSGTPSQAKDSAEKSESSFLASDSIAMTSGKPNDLSLVMEVDMNAPSGSSGPNLSSSNSVSNLSKRSDRDYASPRDDSYRARKLDLIRFRPLEGKLESEEQFKYWKSSCIGQLDSQECLFVLDPNEAPPPEFKSYEINIIKRKVRHFLLESLSQYFKDLVLDLNDPREIFQKLNLACDPCSDFQLRRLVEEFNSIRFDMKSEKAIEFLGRFDELHKKIVSIDPDMFTPKYIKLLFESAISDTATYRSAEMNGFKFTLNQLRDMVLGEQHRMVQGSSHNASMSMFRSRVASSRGRGRRSFGAKGNIPGRSGAFPLKKVSEASKPQNRKVFCSYCKKRGHDIDSCLKRVKACFKCKKSDGHFASNCPLGGTPASSQIYTPNAAKLSKPKYKPSSGAQRSQTSSTQKSSIMKSKPRMYSMPNNQARRLEQEFHNHPDSVFSVIGPKDSDHVWVAMTDEEEQHVATINYVSESQGKGQVFQLVEDTKESWA